MLGWLVCQAKTQESLLSSVGGGLTVLWVWGLQMEWDLWACSCPAVSEPFRPLSLLLESMLGKDRSQGGSSEEHTTIKGQIEMLDLPIFDSEPVGDRRSTVLCLYLPDIFLLPIWLLPPVASLPLCGGLCLISLPLQFPAPYPSWLPACLPIPEP